MRNFLKYNRTSLIFLWVWLSDSKENLKFIELFCYIFLTKKFYPWSCRKSKILLIETQLLVSKTCLEGTYNKKGYWKWLIPSNHHRVRTFDGWGKFFFCDFDYIIVKSYKTKIREWLIGVKQNKRNKCI